MRTSGTARAVSVRGGPLAAIAAATASSSIASAPRTSLGKCKFPQDRPCQHRFPAQWAMRHATRHTPAALASAVLAAGGWRSTRAPEAAVTFERAHTLVYSGTQVLGRFQKAKPHMSVLFSTCGRAGIIR